MANMPDPFQADHKVVSEDSHNSSESIKAVAIYEIIKGVGALSGAAALWLWHSDLEHWLANANHSWQRYFGELLAPQVESVIRVAQKASQNWTYLPLETGHLFFERS